MTTLNRKRRGYSIDDVAQAYGLPQQCVLDEIDSGRLKSMQVGTRRIITREHLRAWEQECTA